MKALSKRSAFFILLISAGLVAFILQQAAFVETLEKKSVDYRFQLVADGREASDRILIVEIDDYSLRRLEDVFGRWPWPREAHADFLRFMERAGAKVIVFDILFTERDLQNPDSDREFVEWTARTGNVVHSAFPGDQHDTGTPDLEIVRKHSIEKGPGSFPEFVQLDLPFEGLAAAARGVGHVGLILDDDGPARHYLPLIENRGRLIPSIGLVAVLVERELPVDALTIGPEGLLLGSEAVPVQDGRIPIWFNGAAGTYPSVSYGEIIYSQLLIDAGEEPIVSPEQFHDQIVLVGVSAAGLHDVFTTPFNVGTWLGWGEDVGGKMHGIELHANMIDNFLHGRYFRSLWGGTGLTAALLLAGAALVPILWLQLALAVPAALAAMGAYLLAAGLAFPERLALPVAFPALSWLTALLLGLGYQYWTEGREKLKVRGMFSRYVSPDVFQQLMKDPASAELGGKRIPMTVLFSDLRGFTAMSENRDPEEVVEQLNEYFTEMVEIVFRNRGTIDKFVGDMIMALFGAPVADDRHAENAVECARQMQLRLEEMNRKWAERGMPALQHGIGVNSGEMVAGNVGSSRIQSYTVIGDNVNLGARLESLCKEYGAGIIISEFTRELLASPNGVRELGSVTVKGKSRPVRIYSVEWNAEAPPTADPVRA